MIQKLLKPKRLLLLFIAVNLVIGLFTVSDYGLSIDESQETDRAEIAMRRYTLHETGDPVGEYEALGINQYYGTVLMMVFLTAENVLRPLLGTARHDILHYTFFITFQVGVYLVFVLARRWIKEWWALAAALLFGTQPLYYGHAFINPKDIPGMVIFLATVVVGFRMADKVEAQKPPIAAYRWKLGLMVSADWQRLKEATRKRLRNFFIFEGVLVFLWALRVHLWLVSVVIGALFHADQNSFLGRLFARLAPNAGVIPVEDYIARGQAVIGPAVNNLLVVLLAGSVLFCLLFFRRARRDIWQESVSTYFKKSIKMDRRGWLAVAAAGAVWGVAISTRATAIAAGGMIGLYMLLRLREKAVLSLAGYTLAAAAACFITWPYLWYFGVQGFLEGMQAFANYPYVGGRIWYRGSIPHEAIPRTFLLQVMAIQFTEPLVILSVVGIVLAVVLAVRKQLPRLDVFILLCWFFLPILYSAIAQPTLYNNFRQFFFVTTPLFVFAGLAMAQGARLLRRGVVLAVVLALVFAPGVVEIARLHPYQYVYYNQAVGGVEGAYRYYEMDYWVISYKEAIEYLNEYAPEGSQILVVSGGDVADQYARPDLDFIPLQSEISDEELQPYDYVLMTTNHRHTQLENLYALETAYAVKAGDAVLTYVKVIDP
ncbi:MAG TPA: hypothetical protein VJ965_02985 [Anaerolineales bacterium]|nr:hypothetical protein [Anaerolineales bacterium]